MAEPRIKTTIEFDPYDFERLRAYADRQDVGLATAIIGLLDGKGVRIPFTAPAVEDIRAHVAEKGYTFDPEAFHAYYSARGWKLSGQMMRNWKAACVTWQKREKPVKGGYPSAAELKEFNKSMVGANAQHYLEVFRATFHCDPKEI